MEASLIECLDICAIARHASAMIETTARHLLMESREARVQIFNHWQFMTGLFPGADPVCRQKCQIRIANDLGQHKTAPAIE